MSQRMNKKEQLEWVAKFQDRAFAKCGDDPEKLREAMRRLANISPPSLPFIEEMIEFFG